MVLGLLGRFFFLASATISLAVAKVISSPASAFSTAFSRASSGTGGSRQEVGGAGLDGQIRNFCGLELLGHAHEVLRRPLAPAKFRLEPRQELAVRQGFLNGQQVVADLDDVFDGLLDPFPDAVRGTADLVGELGFEQVVIEADDDQLALGLLGHGSLSSAGDGAEADDGLPRLGLPRQLPRFRQSVAGGADSKTCRTKELRNST
jgi:hypothetical protein